MSNNKLTGGVDGVSSKVKGERVEAMPGREGRVGFPRADGIECEFNGGEEIRPAGGGERDVTGG